MTKGDRLSANANTMFIVAIITMIAGLYLAFAISTIMYVLYSLAAWWQTKKANDMTPKEQTLDEKLRKKIGTLVHLHHYGFCTNGCYKSPRDKWDELCEARAAQYENKLISLILDDRQSLLEELKKHASDATMLGRPITKVVPLSVIESLLGERELIV